MASWVRPLALLGSASNARSSPNIELGVSSQHVRCRLKQKLKVLCIYLCFFFLGVWAITDPIHVPDCTEESLLALLDVLEIDSGQTWSAA